jgi:hypothetical protein
MYEGPGDENRRLKKIYDEERLKAEIVAKALTKVVVLSQRREIAQWVMAQRSATINLGCRAFGISQTCYQYKTKLNAENSLIAEWLVPLTNNQCNWGFAVLPLPTQRKGNSNGTTRGSTVFTVSLS